MTDKEVIMADKWIKRKANDRIWWLQNTGLGEFVFSFDKQKQYNLFRDYPKKLSHQEKMQFDNENPYWANFFRYRSK